MSAGENNQNFPELKQISSKPILAEPESISPQKIQDAETIDVVGSSRKSSRRLPPDTTTASVSTLSTAGSITDTPEQHGTHSSHHKHRHHHRHHRHVHHQHQARYIISQVAAWLENEKAKRAARQGGKYGGHRILAHAVEKTNDLAQLMQNHTGNGSTPGTHRPTRKYSGVSDDGIALEKLEQILAQSIDLDADDASNLTDSNSYLPRRKVNHHNSHKFLRKGSTVLSSDTEYQEPDIDVPSAEVVLDNSRTLSCSGGGCSSERDAGNLKKRATKDREAWLRFKYELLRLCHTLRLKGWRRLPLEVAEEIDVERLSGAFTNAVYVVSPPPTGSCPESLTQKKPPAQLLLRIYGPQVEHLIDRENELQILRRLARQRIGPRLLGTFVNGRFEEFFHARTLTSEDLRAPETSTQIAKRMRELHNGIELLEEERSRGAFIWRNWDKWKDRCEEVMTWLDDQILQNKQGNIASNADEWKKRGLVCGVEWSVFRATVRKYREWLYQQFGGEVEVRQRLVFAHNDTQYGNLLRLQPSGESPLLLPSNEHKQLVVIDFEYASANLPGLEFANHFTEWCYDYHDSPSYVLHESWYPNPSEQHRFLKAYIQHRSLKQPTPATPAIPSKRLPRSSISSFMLDSRAAPVQIEKEERQREEDLEAEIQRLSHETRLWRVANSAQWVAWGIVQAKVPGMIEALETRKRQDNDSSRSTNNIGDSSTDRSQAVPSSDALDLNTEKQVEDASDKRSEEAEEDTIEFDYLGYAQERALFFWGDVLQLGVVGRDELPQELLEKVKIVEY